MFEEGVHWVLMRTLNNETPGYHGIASLMRPGHPSGVKLLPRDLAIWLAIVERTNYRTGRCEWTLKAIAEEIGLATKYLTQSVKRLKEADLIRSHYNPTSGQRWYLASPLHMFLGTAQRNNIAEAEWETANRQMTEEAAKEAVEDSEMAERIANHNRALNLRGA